jgi:hypothetical protein
MNRQILLAFFILLLMGDCIVAGMLLQRQSNIYYSLSNLRYLLQSKLENNEQPDENTTVYLSEDVATVLANAYFSFDVEYGFCLYGERIDGNYYIDKATAKKITYSDSVSMVAYACDNLALISLHTHPGGICELSDIDIETHRIDTEKHSIRKDQLMAVQCDYYTYRFFNLNNYKKSLKWEILEG